MSADPFLGSIHIFGFNYAPRGYAMCNGQAVSIAQNNALFSLLGTQYGGDGQTTFALPDLRGRAPIHVGQGPGLTSRSQGESAGSESVTLITTQLPAHNHTFVNGASTLTGSAEKATLQTPAAGSRLARAVDGSAAGALPRIYVPSSTTGATVELGTVNVAGTITPTGGNLPHPNMQPYLVLNFCIALQGIFPARN